MENPSTADKTFPHGNDQLLETYRQLAIASIHEPSRELKKIGKNVVPNTGLIKELYIQMSSFLQVLNDSMFSTI